MFKGISESIRRRKQIKIAMKATEIASDQPIPINISSHRSAYDECEGALRNLIVSSPFTLEMSPKKVSSWLFDNIKINRPFEKDVSGKLLSYKSDQEAWARLALEVAGINNEEKDQLSPIPYLCHDVPLDMFETIECPRCRKSYSSSEIERNTYNKNEGGTLRTIQIGRQLNCPKNHELAFVISKVWSEQFEGELEKVFDDIMYHYKDRLIAMTGAQLIETRFDEAGVPEIVLLADSNAIDTIDLPPPFIEIIAVKVDALK